MKTVTFSDIIGKNGVFIDGDWVESKDQDPNGEVRLLQLADIGDGYFINKSNRFLTKESAKKLRCTFLEAGDILVARMPDPLGRACIFPGLDKPCVTVVDVCIIRPDKKIVSIEWLKFLINSFDYRNTINKFITGTTRQRISRGNLAKLAFKLPLLQEQIRIAKILTQAENLIIQRKESILLLDELLKSTFLEMFGDPVRNEKGWIISNIGKQCNVKGGKRIPKESKLVKENTGYPYIKAGNIKKGKITTANLEYLTPELRQFLKRYTVEKGDVCITVVGANIGDIGIVPEELHLANLTENANKVLIKDKLKLNNIYLGFYLMMDFVQNNFNSKIRAAGVPKLALFRIEEINLLMPPIELQNKFATIVEKVETLKTEYQASLKELENMYGVLSQKAFKGELKVKEYTNSEVLGMVAETEAEY